MLHEAIREHSMEAGKRVKMEGVGNDLLERISRDPLFAAVHNSLDQLLNPSLFVGIIMRVLHERSRNIHVYFLYRESS